MEEKIKKTTTIVKLIDIYGYISALYELLIKHNFGLGVVLTLISLALSCSIYVMGNIDKIRKKYGSKKRNNESISSQYKIIIVVHIAIWGIVLILWSSEIGSVFTTIFFGFILYNMPIIFIIITDIFCYILHEDRERYKYISSCISLLLSGILLLLFMFSLEGRSIWWLVFEIILQIIPFSIAADF